MMYFRGQGVPRNNLRAHMWLSLAASAASDASTRENSVNTRDLVVAKMTRGAADGERVDTEPHVDAVVVRAVPDEVSN
jgi:TPR repeat protein